MAARVSLCVIKFTQKLQFRQKAPKSASDRQRGIEFEDDRIRRLSVK